jgi:hypothetical protein
MPSIQTNSDAWKPYTEAEFETITGSGGKITGYYVLTEFAAATSEAFATIDGGTVAKNEVYRAKLAAPLPLRPWEMEDSSGGISLQ